MKKIILGLITLSAFTSCSSEDSISGSNNNDRIISLNAGVETSTKITTLSTTGPINSDFTTDFSIGIYAKSGAWLAGAANVINNDPATVLGAAGHSVTFANGPYYYPDDGALVNFYAFAPAAVESTPAAAGTSPVVTHTITGHEDVMWASSNGKKVGSNPADNPVLNFEHKLTQLQFTFKSGTGYPASGNKVVSLTLKGQPTKVVMNVEDGSCTFSETADMQALSSTNQSAGISISQNGTNAASPLMSKASSGVTAYFLDVVVKPGSGAANVSYENIPVNVNSVTGSAHMITLTFSNTAISATATVADWIMGTGGSAEAQ